MPLKLIIEAVIENPAEDVDVASMWLEDDIRDAILHRFSAEDVMIDDLSVREH